MPSEKCRVKLQGNPACSVRKEVLGFVMCYAQNAMQTKGVDMSTGMKEGWEKVREQCGDRRKNQGMQPR